MARSDTRKATSTRKKRDIGAALKDLMKKPEYDIKRKRKGPRGNTIPDYTVDGKPMTRRRVEGVGMMDSPRAMADKPLGPPKKPTGLKDTTSKKGLSEFGKAFAAARKAGKKEFMFKGEPYHTRTKEEEAVREEEAARKAKSTSKKYGGKMVKKKEGGSMGSKSKSSKPKGVGCATRGYGKAMKG